MNSVAAHGDWTMCMVHDVIAHAAHDRSTHSAHACKYTQVLHEIVMKSSDNWLTIFISYRLPRVPITIMVACASFASLQIVSPAFVANTALILPLS